jgi:membrane protein required for colicin V production
MTYYDAAMIGVVLAGMIWGAWRGVVWQMASIASLVLGYVASHPLSGQLAPHFPGEPAVARSLAMLVVYVAVSAGVFLLAWLVRTTLRTLQFEAFDRHLGMLLGGLEGALIGLVATLFVVSLAPKTRAPIFASPAGKVVAQVMASVGPVLPTEVRTVLNPFLNDDPSDDNAVADEGDSLKRRKGRSTNPDDADATDSDDRTVAKAKKPGTSATTSLQNLIDEGEARVGRAIVETAKKELQKAETDDSDDRTVERR